MLFFTLQCEHRHTHTHTHTHTHVYNSQCKLKWSRNVTFSSRRAMSAAVGQVKLCILGTLRKNQSRKQKSLKVHIFSFSSAAFIYTVWMFSSCFSLCLHNFGMLCRTTDPWFPATVNGFSLGRLMAASPLSSHSISLFPHSLRGNRLIPWWCSIATNQDTPHRAGFTTTSIFPY